MNATPVKEFIVMGARIQWWCALVAVAVVCTLVVAL